ncbi:MAG: MBL fold metallo-hydrolase [bacterium]|nr:MBL fold metallo-hydrolase [bacterium]
MTSRTPAHVLTLTVGPLETNCYLLVDLATSAVLCIDPGADARRIQDTIHTHAWHPCGIALTHGHGDHIGAVAALRATWQVPLFVHELDAPMLPNAERNLSVLLGHHIIAPHPDHPLNDADHIPCGTLRLEVLHTPGHTPGSVCFYLPSSASSPPLLFSGDTLFREEVGRCDLPGGSWQALQTSITSRLYPLPSHTIVYPGHGPTTTIGHEQRSNPYVRLS